MTKIIANIKNFMESNFNTRKENEIELDFIRLNGLSNTIYLVKVFDKTSKTLVKELIYRSFGEISELVDRETEKEIIDNLSIQNLTPKIFETDEKTYRIEEYIGNSDVLPRVFIKEDFIIEKMINLLVAYSLITSIYNFSIVSDCLSQEYKISFDPQIQEIKKQNMYDKCMNLMFNKAKKNFEKFKKKMSKKYDNFINEEVMNKIDKINYYMDNYKNLFTKVFPKNGIASLCHNDVHRLNLLLTEDTEKIIILDHEYSCLNLAGVDIVNFMIESNFDYTKKTFPFYEFEGKTLEVDFGMFYQVFLEYMNKFETAHSINSKSEHYLLFQKCKKPKYFYKIVCVISLFWLVYSVMYMDYEDLIQKKSFDQISHGIDRITIFEKAISALQQIKLKKEVNKMASHVYDGDFY